MGDRGPSRSQLQQQQGAEADLAKRQKLLEEEEEAEKKAARERELANIRRAFGSTGGGLPTKTSLLG